MLILFPSPAISWDCFTEFTLSRIMRFFPFTSFRARMTKSEGFAMILSDGNLFRTFAIVTSREMSLNASLPLRIRSETF
jgi:hypothetical protein